MSDNKEILNRKSMEKGATVAGVGLGVGAASAIGTIVGSGGALGALGSAFGLTVAAATPVGWLIGGAAVGGAAIHYGAKLIGAKGKSDGIVFSVENSLTTRHQKRMQAIGRNLAQVDVQCALDLLTQVIENNPECKDMVVDIYTGVQEGVTPPNEAIGLACQILSLNSSDYLENENISITELIAIVSIAVVMMLANGELKEGEELALCHHLKKLYHVDKEDTSYLIEYILNRISSAGQSQFDFHSTILSFAEFIASNVHLGDRILTVLDAIANADNDFDEKEQACYAFVKRSFLMARDLPDYKEKIESVPKEDSNILLNSNNGFNEKVQGAIDAYAHCIPLSSVFAMYDGTLLGSGMRSISQLGESMFGGNLSSKIPSSKVDKGFLFTTLAIVSNKREIVFYNEISKANDIDGYIILETINGIVPLDCKSSAKPMLVSYFNSLK